MNSFVDINLNQNKLLDACFQALATPPSNPVAHQYYFDTADNTLKYWNGTKWAALSAKDVMILKGTVGVGGDVANLPLDEAAAFGNMYICASNGTYSIKDGVTVNAKANDIFICIKNGSSAFEAEWKHIATGSSKFQGTITGDAATTDFNIAHNLSSDSVVVAVYDDNNDLVLVDVQIKDANNIIISFAVAPATTETYKVVVLA